MTIYNDQSDVLVLDTGATGVSIGSPTACRKSFARYITFGANISVTAKTLEGNLTFYGSCDPVPGTEAIVAAMFPLTTAVMFGPASVTGLAVSGGVFAFATPFLDIGTSRFVVRIPDPPPVVVPVFTFSAGGGVRRIRVKAVY
jgi:hypothetical protein